MSKPQVWSEDRTLKQCTNCLEMKPPAEFHRLKRASGGFGLQSWCKACGRAQALAWANKRYRDDPEWRAKKLSLDREKGMAKRAAHRVAHPRILLTPEERLERQRASGRKSTKRPDAMERIRVHSRNYRALVKMQAEGVPITKEVWQSVIEKFGHRCAYCKVQTEFLELDHVVPIRRGGAHSVDNIAPACRGCNTSKNNRTLDEWTPPTEPQKVVRCLGRRKAWKLTDKQVVEIRARRAAGERGRALAKEYGVHEQHITDIVHGRTRAG